MISFEFKKLNHWVFWPPFLLLIVALAYSLLAKEAFLRWVNGANQWILDHFDHAFNVTAFFMVILSLVLFLSPLGKVKIGGSSAVPMLNRWRWFSIVLCTTIAVGILFWGVCEPLYHLSAPPTGHSAQPYSTEARDFAMSTMFMHWTFSPYAIYAIPALMFALGYYNRKRSFSLTTMLFPLYSGKSHPVIKSFINSLCMFALVAGMAAALGAGILTLSGGLASFTNSTSTSGTLGLITLMLVGTFSVSAASGLLKGIRVLSGINFIMFVVLCALMITFGPAQDMLSYGWHGLRDYLGNFVDHSLARGEYSDANWTHAWTTFYWAVWMAWAPVTCLFLGKISYGYTVREFFLFNWIIPSLFSILWMSIFSGTAISFQLNGQVDLVDALTRWGPESVVYQIFDHMPSTDLLTGFFLLIVFVSYVTAADSSTDAISGLSAQGVSPDTPDPPRLIKYLWGGLIGLTSWVMISYTGVDGIKMLSNLGGLPALVLLIPISIAALVWLIMGWKNRIWKSND